jgi:hypothetical protein
MAKKKAKKSKIPQSSEAKAARQALIAADLVGLESDRARMSDISRGSYTGGSRSGSATGSGRASRSRAGPSPVAARPA